ncbi:glycosyltransferase family 52 [Acinetobacter lwoffii]|uniref:glycosyltransferase family 52 n=1 Tax=Acinetobacter lwoffii TaxID=28090 RepID=UPI0020984C29|nr:glycosyltransferase family 52 [Acinetobacter lwoffii]MCO8082534.1 glycosyltransferase family 52 protein [Acinetobacter lwoffii]
MKALLVIRTPFQAWLAQKVLEKEKVSNFDLVYFTQNNSDEDKYYYAQLSIQAKRSQYIFIQRQRFDIFSHLLFKIKAIKWYFFKNYDLVMYASINALVPNSLVSKYNQSELITFDDGAANIVKQGIFYNEPDTLRAKLYRIILGAKSLDSIKKRIKKHYSIYPHNPNIVESDRLIHIDGWESDSNRLPVEIRTYFIGAPFEEVMNSDQIARMVDYLRQLDITAYVKHPRERNILDLGVKQLNKNSRIAEDAIIADAQGRSIRLIGWFSSVMFSLEAVCVQRIILLPKDSSQSVELAEICKKSGCHPIFI